MSFSAALSPVPGDDISTYRPKGVDFLQMKNLVAGKYFSCCFF
jgi:hypothetical protein